MQHFSMVRAAIAHLILQCSLDENGLKDTKIARLQFEMLMSKGNEVGTQEQSKQRRRCSLHI